MRFCDAGSATTTLAATGLAVCLISAAPVLAQTATPTTAAPAAPAAAAPGTPAAAPAAEAAAAPPSGLVIDGIKLSAQIDAGFSLNPARPTGNALYPADGLNFGQLFTDHANQAQLNQILLTAQKALDPKDPGYQWGFKVQGMYGSDARYTQFLGELNNVVPNDRYQFDIVEADVQAHLPWLTAGGIDLKAGQYPTPLGYETIDPSTNPFYSHSYIFQFGLPFKHTGALATTHVNDVLDVYSGIDTGTNTTWGPLGDNNGAIGGIGGINLTLLGGNLTALALTHFGPEDATRLLSPQGVNANGQWRYYNDIVVTWKATDKWTLVTELNWVRDGYGQVGKTVNGYGAAEYASYALTDTVALNGRAEVWRDDNNFFVAAFPGNTSYVKAQQGFPVFVVPAQAPNGTAFGNTTYGALTFGVTWKPALPAPVSALAIRPELRWDHALTGNDPFNGQRDNNAFTLACDAVLGF
jgi:hypothetical protein